MKRKDEQKILARAPRVGHGNNRTRAKVAVLGGALAMLLSLAPNTAFAQNRALQVYPRPELKRGETVLSRSRPELDAAGIRAGGFLVFPELVVEEQFTDNVFAAKHNKRSDQITVVQPRLSIRSNWNRHAIGFASRASVGIHAEETKEDYQDHRHFLNGRIDLARDAVINTWARYESLHQFRRSADDSGGVEPTEYDILVGGGDIRKELGRFNFSLGGEIAVTNYDDNCPSSYKLAQLGV